jgi:protein TonB
MKSKKNPGKDLESKRSIFFQIGLLITLCLVLAAFEWSSVPNNGQSFEIRNGFTLDKDIYLPPQTELLKPPPPPLPEPSDILNIVEEIDPLSEEFKGIDVEPLRDQGIEIMVLPEETGIIETLPEYAVTEKPGFQGGGLEGFRIWVMENLRYPEIAVKNGVSGKVYIRFTVNSRGFVQDVEVLRAADPALAEEALRVVSSSPRWSPGKRGIKTVNVVFTMPVNFVLR